MCVFSSACPTRACLACRQASAGVIGTASCAMVRCVDFNIRLASQPLELLFDGVHQQPAGVGMMIESDFYATDAGRQHFAVSKRPVQPTPRSIPREVHCAWRGALTTCVCPCVRRTSCALALILTKNSAMPSTHRPWISTVEMGRPNSKPPSEATREKNRQRERERNRANPEENRSKVKEWIIANREKKKNMDAAYYMKNKSRMLNQMSVYRAENKEVIAKKALERQKQRRLEDDVFVVTTRMRARLGKFLNEHHVPKRGHTFDLIGKTPDQLKVFLFSRLLPGESLNSVEVDHIFPLTVYDITTGEGQRMAMHFSNLTPLTKEENREKNAKLPTKAMASLVQKWAWPPGVTESMLPDIYPGWDSPFRKHKNITAICYASD